MLAATGHVVVLVGFVLPWVAGEFGARSELSGLALARLADGLATSGATGDALTMPVARIVLLLVPLAAANALLLMALARLGVIRRDTARRGAMVLAMLMTVTGATALVLLSLGTRESTIIAGPALGLYVTMAGAGMASLSSLRRSRKQSAIAERVRTRVEHGVHTEA